MKTITITIQVPDGVNVNVSQGNAAPQREWVEREPPPYPGGGCPIHDIQWKLVPAGVSKNKTNPDGSPKRYNAFWACPERGCNELPPREQVIEDVTGQHYADDLPF